MLNMRNKVKGYADGGEVQDPIQEVQQTGNQIMGPYTPDKRQQLYQSLIESRQNPTQAAGTSLANIGQAIAKGYGGDKSANYLDPTLQAQQNTSQQALGAFDTGREQTAQNFEMGEKGTGIKEDYDPNSGTSQTLRMLIQQATGKKLPPNISAIQLRESLPMLTKNLELAVENRKANIQQQSVDVEKARAEQEKTHQQQEVNLAEKTRQAEAAKSLAGQGFLQRIQQSVFPSDAQKKLQEIAGIDQGIDQGGTTHGIPDVGQTFNGQKIIGVKRIK